MALGFGRKKAADNAAAPSVSAPLETTPLETTPLETTPLETTPLETTPLEAAPVAAHAPSSPSSAPADDFDAFDLDAFADAPLAATPTSDAASPPLQSAHAGAADSAFDFPGASQTQLPVSPVPVSGTAQVGDSALNTPDFDRGYEIEQASVARSGHTPAPAPFVPPSATIHEPAVPFYETQTTEPVLVAAPKKKFPLLPLLGALAVLGLVGAGAYTMTRGGQTEEETAPPQVASRPPRVETPVATIDKPVAPTNRQAAPLEVVRVKPVPVKAGAGTVTKVPKIVTITNGSPVRPGIAPASDQLTQLKALWNRGADAKHRNDFAAARRYWTQGLKLQPGNVGFKDSIAKLPK